VTNKLSKGFVVTYREKFGPAKVLFKGHTNDTELVDVGSREMDISLLKVVGDFPECDSVKFLDGSPCIGDETLTEGYILNFLGPPTTTFGFFTTANQRVSPTETVDQLQLPVYPGHSGAGVYIMTGECIGLAEARMSDGLGFTVSSERIYEWARLHHIEWALDSSEPLP
jgi:S1-C subfamily serine protease